MAQAQSHWLLVSGMLIFILGLINGVVIPRFKNKRMGLSSHLVGVQHGLVFLAFGLMWPRLELAGWLMTSAFWLTIYGLYAIWIALLLAGVWGTSKDTPIAGDGYQGTESQEMVAGLLLKSGSVAILVASIIVFLGLL